ncbi:phosphomethylpyrimidine synthase ThiC [Desulfothermus naphthae]
MLEKNSILSDIIYKYREHFYKTEGLEFDVIKEHVENGKMVLLYNPKHKGVNPTLIGQPSKIKVNANLGTSPFLCDINLELSKLDVALKAGAHTVMDLSTGGDLDLIRTEIIKKSPLPVGTVPIYSVAQKYIKKGQDVSKFSENELLEEIEKQAEQGVDFMTLHCGVTKRAAEMAKDRVLGIVSRGGSILAKWMEVNKKENPLLTNFDKLLDISLKYNIVISLGDGLRPGAICDAGDEAQMEEVVVLGELTKMAWEKGVQVMIEGPGHVPLHLVAAQIKCIKTICHNAPLYVLGPLTTDIAAGYDHIAGAIGGAIAAYAGADFLCYVTPAEHVTLPNENDVYQGVMASLVAANSAEIALGYRDATNRSKMISKARNELNWDMILKHALDPNIIKKRREKFAAKEECAMCGEFCALKMLK